MVLTLIILLVVIGLLFIDFYFGQRFYQKHPPIFHFDKQEANFDLITTGESFYTSLFKDIKNATKQVDISFFIVRNDDISKQFYELLIMRAKEGITVRLMLDKMGSNSLKKEIISELKASGVQVVFSDKPSFPYFFYRLNRRNHRKISVIDNEIAYTGGFNVGKEYLGKDPKLGPWRDYHLRATGEVVANFQVVFNYDWEAAIKGNPVSVDYVKGEASGKQEDRQTKTLKLVVSEAGQLEDKFVSWINDAKSEILIGTPYFIPSKEMFDALMAALHRGVEVNVLVPAKKDHPLVKPAGFPFYRQLMQAGGKVYMFTNGFYHAKVIIIDESFCDIGTANFDMRSVFLNKEINVIMDSETDIKEIRSAYFKDVKSSQQITVQWLNQQPITIKIEGMLARLVRPLL
ncbi:cardiolipin synthase [Aquibacillus halophilus]|uniref:cardiolipin synthase n=1 Tax=Aquibacillus halophilus TaxID=930132 RepID=UPI0014797DF5|nr:cardiolipin synthase [Aquibacillus halophilus]